MSVEVLISTMHKEKDEYSLLDYMNIQTNAVVINQCNRCDKKVFNHNGNKIIWIDTTERGLSKSRNKAIANASSDICLLADDDEILLDGYKDIIEKAFYKHQDYDLIRFKIRGIEKNFKEYQIKPCEINMRLSLKISSVEVAFKRKTIVDKALIFDELIGAGTEFLMGEENAFIVDYLRKKCRAWYEPVEIAKLHVGNSSWFTGFNEEYYFARGASYAAISPMGSYFLSILFALKHRKNTALSIVKTSCLMFRGIRCYKKKKELQYGK